MHMHAIGHGEERRGGERRGEERMLETRSYGTGRGERCQMTMHEVRYEYRSARPMIFFVVCVRVRVRV